MVNVALFGWPIVSSFFFRLFGLRMAILVTLVGGFLLLPPATSIDFPMLPPINKDTVAAVTALLLAALFMGKVPEGAAWILQGWLPRSRTAQLMILLLIVGTFLTVQTNGEWLVAGFRNLPPLKLYDAFSVLQGILIALVPFFLGRKFFATSDGHRMVLIVLCVAGFAYSLLALYEVRMSPQLNSTFYGYFPHSWRQHIRGGGFRPIVFLEHGLVLGIFLCCSLLAAVACFRARVAKDRWRFLLIAAWLLMTLLLSKTLGALMIALFLLPVLLFVNVRAQLLVAGTLGAIVLLFPMLRGADLVPTDQILSFSERIDPARAGSLAYRFENEDRLLDKANEKALFGWGGWGRSRVFDERGYDIATTDGRWVIVLGLGGWTRYIGEFGLLTFSVILLALRSRSMNVSLATSGLSIVLTGNLIDLIPNSGLSPVTWLLAGALYGRLEVGREKASQPIGPAAARKIGAGYARNAGAGPDSEEGTASGMSDPPLNAYTRQTRRHRRQDSKVFEGY